MLDTERQKLLNMDSEYLSIGITENGARPLKISVPWEVSAHAYNMKLPNVYFAPEDLKDKELMNSVAKHTVIGCYIWAPLKDYSFLSQFAKIRDLSIRNGDNIRDLDFLTGLDECRMLFLQNAKLKDLNTVLKMKKASQSLFKCFACVGLYNCSIDDLSGFEDEKYHFSEFLVWNYTGKDDKERWKVISANTWRYYAE